MLATLPDITKSDINKAIESISTTYTYRNIKVASGKFPVIIFAPGSQTQVEFYQNIITQLVSNGYIVIGIDSVFVSGKILLPNGTITSAPPVNFPDCDFPKCTVQQLKIIEQIQSDFKMVQTSDLYYMLNQFKYKENDQLAKSMDFNHMGGLGHSLGARLINEVVLNDPMLFKSAIALDVAPIGNNEDYPLATQMPIPFLFGMSANFKQANFPINMKFDLNLDSYYVGFAPTVANEDYSQHMSYSDLGTFQYQPLLKTLFTSALGMGNGYNIINSVNIYLLQFFDTYLKDKSNPVFNHKACIPLSSNSYISCGPTESNLKI